MADFPTNPTIGQTFTATDGTLWTWDGYSWIASGGYGSTGGGGATPFTVPNNVGLTYASDVLSTSYNTTMSDSVNSVVVGGASALPASTWKTKNLVQVLDTILFPDQYPTYTIPTLSFSGSQSGTKEIGQTISQVTSSTGTENDAGVFNSIAIRRNSSNISVSGSLTAVSTTDIAAQYGYTDPNNPNYTYTYGYTDSFTVVSGTTTWNSFANYSAGLAKNNNKGVSDDRAFAIRSTSAPQSACTSFTSSSVSVTGIYPYFWGKSSTQPTASSIASSIAAGTANKVLSDSTGTITVTYNAASEYIWVAHVATSTSKTVWYNTALNTGSIGAGQFILAPVTQNVNSPDSYWSAVSFKVYISGYASSTSGSIEFRNS